MAMIPAQPLDDSESLQTLKTLLDSAGSVLADLIDDPLFARLTRAFARIPAAERETILGGFIEKLTNRLRALGAQ